MSRKIISEYSDDSNYTDEFLWNIFKLGRDEIIAQKYKRNNPQNYVTICIKLEKALSHECGCITRGCEVRKSAKLPRYITNRFGGTLSVYDLDYTQGYYTQEQNYRELQLDDVYKEAPLYSIINQQIILWNKDYEVIQIKAIWEDITDLVDIQYCNNLDSEGNTICIDVYNTDIGLDQEFVRAALLKSLDLLFNSKQIIDDTTSDINPNIK